MCTKFCNRIVITGVGCVNPLGDTPLESFHRIGEGLSGISNIESFNISKHRYKKGGK